MSTKKFCSGDRDGFHGQYSGLGYDQGGGNGATFRDRTEVDGYSVGD